MKQQTAHSTALKLEPQHPGAQARLAEVKTLLRRSKK